MRTRSFILWAIPALMMAGCQNDWENSQQADAGEEATVRITLQAPEAMSTTRADGDSQTNSARGGITNVDWTQYDLRYQIAVYSEDGTVQVVAPVTKTVQKNYADVTFDVRLVNNRTYKFVAWADFIKTGTEGTDGYPADLHYNTADLTNITCLDDETAQLNDESRDAYFITTNQTVNSAAGVSLTLKRPFAKVRVVTTDWQADESYMPDNVKIKYYGCTRFNGLNAITGEATGETTLSGINYEHTVYTATIDPNAYAQGYEAESPNNKTLSIDYLWMENKQTPIHFTIETLENTTTVKKYNFTTDIPTQRNYLTTLLGNFLTENTQVTVTCDEDFIDEYREYANEGTLATSEPKSVGNTYYIETAEELAWLAENELGTTIDRNRKIFYLMNDIDLKGVNWKPINIRNYYLSKNFVFDGQGHTIRNLQINNNNSACQGLFGEIRQTDIKNLTIENAIITLPNSSSITGVWEGCGTIAGYTSECSFENCTVKHVFIHGDDWTTRIGGMVGYHIEGNIKNCTAEDVTAKGNNVVGGLIGQADEKNTYENCTVSNSDLWRRCDPSTNSASNKAIGSIVAYSSCHSSDLILKNCFSSGMEYKVGETKRGDSSISEPQYIVKSGEESSTRSYGPTHALYGRSIYGDNAIIIE